MKINRKTEKAAAIIAFAGSAGYLLRFIYHFTYYVIKIKYSEAILYGLVPCLLIAFYGATLLKNKNRKPFLTGAAACAVTVFSLAVAITKGEESADIAGVIVFIMGIACSLLYLLTFAGKIKTRVPACVVCCLGTVLYFIMMFISCYVYIPSEDTVSSYYGILGSVFGLTMFYLSLTVSVFSLKMNKTEENE